MAYKDLREFMALLEKKGLHPTATRRPRPIGHGVYLHCWTQTLYLHRD